MASSVWLDSYHDPVAGINTQSQLISTSGCSVETVETHRGRCSPGTHRLVWRTKGTQPHSISWARLLYDQAQLLIVDTGTRGDASLKVWEGRTMVQSARLQEAPAGLAVFVVADNTTVPGMRSLDYPLSFSRSLGSVCDCWLVFCGFRSGRSVPKCVSCMLTFTFSPTAAVAVASGPNLFVFRSLRPFYKFTLPPLDISQQARVFSSAVADT